MKFIFFYSDLYEYFNKHIHQHLTSIFQVEAIKINDLKNNHGHTFFGGVSIKIELILQKIKENMGTSILFTDATIFINSNNTHELCDFFNNYVENDLCFADNGGPDPYNIGIILIKCNTETLTFFEKVLTELTHTNGWDQSIINQFLRHHTLRVNTFDRTKIYCHWEFNPLYRDTYLIYKSFIHHDKNINKNFNKRLDLFKKYDLITAEEHHANYKHE